MPLGDLVAEDGSDDAVDVDDVETARHFFAAFDRGFAVVEELGDVERPIEAVILRLGLVASHFRAHGRRVEHARQVESLGFPMLDGFVRFQHIGATDHFLDRAEAELRHQFAHFLGDELHKVHRVLGVAGEVFPQLRVLRGDAHGAGIQMADAHHDAAERNERRGGEAEFFCAEERGDDHVPSRFHLAVRFHDDARTEIIQHERLVRFGEAEFPRQTRVFDGSLRRSARAAVESRDEHDIGVCFRDACGDRADADFRDELHADPRVAVRVLQVVDQLREIFDRINVVMRWWRDESDAGRRTAHFRDPRIHFRAGKLPAFTGLRALGHLDLQLFRLRKIEARHAKTSACDLLDRAVLRVAALIRPSVTRGVFAAFAGVRFSADAVHRDGERLVRFAGNRAVAHRARFETRHDLFHAIHFLDRDGRLRFEI